MPSPTHEALVVLFRECPALGLANVLIIEAQLQRDEDKLYTWHLYAAGARCRFRCLATVVAVTLDERVARWCARPVTVDQAGNTSCPGVTHGAEKLHVPDGFREETLRRG